MQQHWSHLLVFGITASSQLLYIYTNDWNQTLPNVLLCYQNEETKLSKKRTNHCFKLSIPFMNVYFVLAFEIQNDSLLWLGEDYAGCIVS